MNIYDRILQQVDEHQLSTVSFDIFDTLVFRHLNLPADVFSHTVLSEAGVYGISGEDYRILREQAERAARQRYTEAEDITFEQIFSCMPFSKDIQANLVLAELDAERHAGLVNQQLVDVIRNLKVRNIAVYLISDMYLSAEQIKNTFFYAWPELAELPLFVSSETGFTKFSGKMYRYVASAQKANPDTWLHVGDNPDADIKSAEAAGLQTCHFHPQLDTWSIRSLEKRPFLSGEHSSATRLMASMNSEAVSSHGQLAFDCGAFVWGPVMDAFADWVISQSRVTGCRHILCLMREGYLFNPLIEKRLAIAGINDITVSAFYVSRKSAFWPGIDTEESGWLNKVMDTLMTYRGYTLQNFIEDFHADPALFSELPPDLELKNIEGMFIHSEPLYDKLCAEAHENASSLRDKINTQRKLLSHYLSQETRCDFHECAVVDFGNGGTIQHSLETIFQKQAGANLLFYSSLRAYRFVEKTLYRAFISPGNERFRLSERLARSPECVEALLLGSGGSTLSYMERDGRVQPVTGKGIEGNEEICSQFLAGCLSYMDVSHRLDRSAISLESAQAIVARYLLMPTAKEAGLFGELLHQDNFGTDGEYPVIDGEQKKQVIQTGLMETFFESGQSNRWALGDIHWPAGVIALEDNSFLTRAYGLLENDNRFYVESLIKKLIALAWKQVCVYGAGEFFLQMLPYLKQHKIEVLHLVDRRAGGSGTYQVAGYTVITLEQALDDGAKNFVISSHAFRDEIAGRIASAAKERHHDDIRMVGV